MIVDYGTDRSSYTATNGYGYVYTSTNRGSRHNMQGTSSASFYTDYRSPYDKYFKTTFKTSVKPDCSEVIRRAQMEKYGCFDDWSNSDEIDNFLDGFEIV